MAKKNVKKAKANPEIEKALAVELGYDTHDQCSTSSYSEKLGKERSAELAKAYTDFFSLHPGEFDSNTW